MTNNNVIIFLYSEWLLQESHNQVKYFYQTLKNAHMCSYFIYLHRLKVFFTDNICFIQWTELEYVIDACVSIRTSRLAFLPVHDVSSTKWTYTQVIMAEMGL